MDWDGFFGHLVLPSLKELRVTCSPGEWRLTWTPEIIISLINRSKCNIDALVINDTPRIDTVRVHPAMNSLLRHLSDLTTLNLSCVTAPRTFRVISREDLLPRPQNSTWNVTAKGLHALLNLLDAYVDEIPLRSDKLCMKMNIKCPMGPRAKVAYKRYASRASEYKQAGLDIEIWDILMGLNLCFYTDNKDESDDSDEDDDGGSDSDNNEDDDTDDNSAWGAEVGKSES